MIKRVRSHTSCCSRMPLVVGFFLLLTIIATTATTASRRTTFVGQGKASAAAFLGTCRSIFSLSAALRIKTTTTRDNQLLLPPLQLLNQLRGGEIQYPSSLEDLERIVSENYDKLVVVDFYSNNCPPCDAVAPLYEKLSEFMDFKTNVIFVKMNVQDQPDAIHKYGITGWPTFLFIKKGKVQTELVGGKLAEATLRDWIQLLMPKEEENEQ